MTTNKKNTTIAVEKNVQKKLLYVKHDYEKYKQKSFSFSQIIEMLCEEHLHNLE